MITINAMNNSKELRELIRMLERKLGILSKNESTYSGLTLAQCHAVVEIGRAKNISLNELADILNLDSSTMSRTVNNLVNSDLAFRELDPDDRRYVTIKLTDKGTKIFEETEENMNKYFNEIYEFIPSEKKPQVIESLQILLEAIKDKY